MLLALNLRLKNWKFLLFFLALTFFVLLVGNILFSPSGCGGNVYWIFTINPCGVSLGIENALKRSAMILVGWAWFEATGYQSAVSLFTRLSAVLIGKERSFRYVGTGFAFASRVGQELSVARLNAELLFPKIYWVGQTKRFQRKFFVWKTILQTLLRRSFDWVSELTFCGERIIGGSQAYRGGRLEVVFSTVHSDDDCTNEVIKDYSLITSPGDIHYLDDQTEHHSSWIVKAISGEIPHLFGCVQGHIRFNGELIFSSSEAVAHAIRNRSRVIYYVQSSPYNNFSTVLVRDELTLRNKDPYRVDEIVRRLGLDDLLERNPFSLSGGQAMRVALASALVSDAPVLLLDAPFSGLDRNGRAELLNLLEAIKQDKSRIIIISDPQGLDRSKGTDVVRLARAQACIGNQGEVLLALEHCAVRLGERDILQDVSISVCRKTCTLIVGENGSGKTTLLRVMAGQQRMLRGMRYRGHVIGMVAQEMGTQIIEDEPVAQIGYGPEHNKDCPKHNSWQGRARRFVSRMGFGSDTSGLTSFEKRLLVVRSAENADIVLFDEQTKEMNSEAIIKFRRYVISLCRSGKAVVIVTHDPEWFTGCGEKYMLSNGMLKAMESDQHD